MSRRDVEHGRRRISRRIPPESPGLTRAPAQLMEGAQAVPAWVGDDLLRKTQVVWSTVYGREVSPAEAAEILTNVKALAEVLLDIDR